MRRVTETGLATFWRGTVLERQLLRQLLLEAECWGLRLPPPPSRPLPRQVREELRRLRSASTPTRKRSTWR